MRSAAIALSLALAAPALAQEAPAPTPAPAAQAPTAKLGKLVAERDEAREAYDESTFVPTILDWVMVGASMGSLFAAGMLVASADPTTTIVSGLALSCGGVTTLAALAVKLLVNQSGRRLADLLEAQEALDVETKRVAGAQAY